MINFFYLFELYKICNIGFIIGLQNIVTQVFAFYMKRISVLYETV